MAWAEISLIEHAVFYTESYGKRPRLEIRGWVNQSILTIGRCRLVFTAGQYRLVRKNQRERSGTFNGINRFLHIQMSSWRRNKAIILSWYRCDRVCGRIKYNMINMAVSGLSLLHINIDMNRLTSYHRMLPKYRFCKNKSQIRYIDHIYKISFILDFIQG